MSKIVNFKNKKIKIDNHLHVLILESTTDRNPIKFGDKNELLDRLNNLVNESVFKYNKINDCEWYCEELDSYYKVIKVDDLYK